MYYWCCSSVNVRKTGDPEQGPGRKLTVGAELGLSEQKIYFLPCYSCLFSILVLFRCIFMLDLFICIHQVES
ncbi:hypothetical protein QL285_067819 [Trifolium repens]|nr:hypothetical protein QL285_067819 [Trifolium repens]